jgi:uncharacterized protein (TIGR02569 family)
MASAPPAGVLRAFGASGDLERLPGGEGRVVRTGDLVLKPIDDPAESAWVQDLLARADPSAIRVAEPVPTADGAWVHDGWIASRFLEGLRPAAPAWEVVVDAGLALGDALEAARVGGEDVLAARTHRWAVADRVAWGEEAVDLAAPAAEVLDALVAHTGEPDREERLVHADLSGNVLLAPDDVPVVLDVSPCLRPRSWAEAIVVADAVTWLGAPPSMAADFAVDATMTDLLVRALIFRLVAEQLSDDPHRDGMLHPYRRVLPLLSDDAR